MRNIIKGLLLLALLVAANNLFAQNPLGRLPGANIGRGGMSGGGDSLQKRDNQADSITIRFRTLDSTRFQKLDSSLYDFSARFPIPWHHVHNGNLGNASQSLLFQPMLKPGWDHGFHSFDTYNFTLEDTRFFSTTRPYSELVYVLGSKSEQTIGLFMTQNIKPNWNVSAQYRLINAPGFFQNQATNHNNYRLSSWYQGPKKRYQNFFVILGNKLQSSENGGIRDNVNYLDSIDFEDRFNIPTQIGQSNISNRNFFSSSIRTGSKYTNATFLFRQQYDIGQKDSIITDTSVIPLFYPRLRLEHTLSYHTYKYRFQDDDPDSVYYAQNYAIVDIQENRIFQQDHWRELLNDFSIYQYPDAKNSLQYFKVGARWSYLQGSLDTGRFTRNFSNISLHGAYRNKTRNQLWDIDAHGEFFVGGPYIGDYEAGLSLRRMLGRKIGSLLLGFNQVNRTPSFIFDPVSSFQLGTPIDLRKENTSLLFGELYQPIIKLKLGARYYLVNNYAYITDYYKANQLSSPFNLIQVSAEKRILFNKYWGLRNWLILQQTAGNTPVNVPLVFIRSQLGYEGKLGFKNLDIAFGVEFRYFTPYKGNSYSPLMGQFYFQDTETIRMKMPEIAPYVHLRIMSFKAFLRVENLNSLSIPAFNFTNNNVLRPNYPSPGMLIRLGIFWNFVN